MSLGGVPAKIRGLIQNILCRKPSQQHGKAPRSAENITTPSPRHNRPEKYPFTQWVAYGSPRYGLAPNNPVVEFVNEKTGKRTTIIDKNRRIARFPGIEDEEKIQNRINEGSLSPTNSFGVRFYEAEKGCYEMVWEVQPDGRFWEDEDGFGASPDDEIKLSAIIDQDGQFITPFRLYNAGGKRVEKSSSRPRGKGRMDEGSQLL